VLDAEDAAKQAKIRQHEEEQQRLMQEQQHQRKHAVMPEQHKRRRREQAERQEARQKVDRQVETLKVHKKTKKEKKRVIKIASKRFRSDTLHTINVAEDIDCEQYRTRLDASLDSVSAFRGEARDAGVKPEEIELRLKKMFSPEESCINDVSDPW